jgi:hypothetical protein
MSSWPAIQVPILATPPFSWCSASVMAIVAHWCCACHHRSGSSNATAITVPAANQRFQIMRPPPLSRAPMTTAMAKKLTLWSSVTPRPATRPPASHQRQSPVRPILTTMSAMPAHASSAYGVVFAR